MHAMNVTPPNTKPSVKASTDVPLSRRDFLDLTWKAILSICGLAGLGALLQFFDFQEQPTQPMEFDLGLADNYPLDSQTLIPNAQAMLLHAQAGFQVVSLVCPHLGCIVEPKTDGFVCPCHASHFDKQGELVTGPATRSLRPLRLEHRADNHLVLYTD